MATKKRPSGEIPAREFKARCLRVDEVAQTRQALAVTKRGKAVVRVVPIGHEAKEIFGCLSERFEIKGDVESPVLWLPR